MGILRDARSAIAVVCRQIYTQIRQAIGKGSNAIQGTIAKERVMALCRDNKQMIAGDDIAH